MPTKIEWATETWNPTTGCDRISAGCDHCYALTMAKRLKAMGQAKYQTDGDPRTSGPGFGVAVHPDSLDDPLHWRKPRLVFVNSMSDLLHAKIPLSFVRDVFAVIAATPQHTYQILTKRSLRLARVADQLEWPPNLWMGVSVEDATELRRVDHLRQVPAAICFLSCEPLIGSLDGIDLTGISWLICGGESGKDARPMLPGWARYLRDRCVAADIPFFLKQWGEWAPTGAVGIGGHDPRRGFVGPPVDEHGCREEIARVGKHAAGRELDGREWSEFPASVSEVA
jgi:protein gp37